MRLKVIAIIVSFYCLIFAPAFTRQSEAYSLEHEMRNVIEVIGHTYYVGYGPAPWKNEYFDWHLSEKLAEAKDSVTSTTTVEEFHVILNNFFKTMHDLHAGVVFHSTAFASLPFELRTAEDRFFIHRFYDKFVDNPFQTLEPGDEILSMNGEPIKTVFDRYLKEVGFGQATPTNIGYALSSFTSRAGALLQPMPDNLNKAAFVILKKNSKIPRKIAFKWKHNPENLSYHKGLHPLLVAKPVVDSPLIEIRTRYDYSVQAKQENILLGALVDNLGIKFDKKFIQELRKKKVKGKKTPKIDEDSDLANEEEGRKAQEQIEGLILFTKQREGTVVPPLGITTWESKPEDYFEAYIYELNTKQRVGFIRLRTFMPDSTVNVIWKALKEKEEAKEPWDEFAEKINYFKKHTDILVIDQTDNHGGADLYTYALLSMLTNTPLQAVPSHHTLTSRDILGSYEINDDKDKSPEDFFGNREDDSIFGYPLDVLHKNRLIAFYNLLLDYWNKGQMYTDPIYHSGIDTIIPSTKANYVKPIIVLIDEFSMSCGDLFPAILQDNKRALLFGQTTAGAGGAIQKAHFPNRVGIDAYHYTESLLMRANGMPIENIGVMPDVEYRLTADDLANGYQGYAKELKKQIRLLVPNRNSARP